MTKTEFKLLPIDRELIRFYQRHPRTNLSAAAGALLHSWSGAYAKDRSHVLLARGFLKAEVSSTGRYRVSVADAIPSEAA